MFNQQLITIIMNKSELIDAIAADAGITKAAAKLALESFLGNVGSHFEKRWKSIFSRFRILVSI
jgi:nucleoid DNA-binding protein